MTIRGKLALLSHSQCDSPFWGEIWNRFCLSYRPCCPGKFLPGQRFVERCALSFLAYWVVGHRKLRDGVGFCWTADCLIMHRCLLLFLLVLHCLACRCCYAVGGETVHGFGGTGCDMLALVAAAATTKTLQIKFLGLVLNIPTTLPFCEIWSQHWKDYLHNTTSERQRVGSRKFFRWIVLYIARKKGSSRTLSLHGRFAELKDQFITCLDCGNQHKSKPAVAVPDSVKWKESRRW